MEYPFTVVFKGIIGDIFHENDTLIKFKIYNSIKRNSHNTVVHEINITCFRSELFDTITNNVGEFCTIYGYLKYTTHKKGDTWYSGNQVFLQDIRVLNLFS